MIPQLAKEASILYFTININHPREIIFSTSVDGSNNLIITYEKKPNEYLQLRDNIIHILDSIERHKDLIDNPLAYDLVNAPNQAWRVSILKSLLTPKECFAFKECD
jgi:hypothetical protein